MQVKFLSHNNVSFPHPLIVQGAWSCWEADEPEPAVNAVQPTDIELILQKCVHIGAHKSYHMFAIPVCSWKQRNFWFNTIFTRSSLE